MYENLMEEVVSPENYGRALKAVIANKGAPGIDGMKTEEWNGHLLKHWPKIHGKLIERYKRCGKPGCKCADGPGHGPKYYLSVSYPGSRYGKSRVMVRSGAVSICLAEISAASVT